MAAIPYLRAASARMSTVVWRRLSFAALLAVTFVLYMWGVDRVGWANAYYAAAVEAARGAGSVFLRSTP